MSTTPNLGLPYIDAGQAQKHVTHNEALRVLDTLVQLAVLDRDLAAPPVSPAEGQRWIVKTGATGAWSSHDNRIAAWQDGAWQFSTPAAGWVAYVADEEILVAWDGSAWVAPGAGAGGGGAREVLTANRTLYVRTDGSDGNDGSANDAAHAFLTPGAAYSAALKLDLNGFTVTLQLADGAYASGIAAASPPVGGNIVVSGNPTTPTSVAISASSPIAMSAQGVLTVQNMRLNGSFAGITVNHPGALLKFGAGISFGGSPSSAHILVQAGKVAAGSNNFTIASGGLRWLSVSAGNFEAFNSTITFSGTPAWTSEGIFFDVAGVVSLFNVAMSGAATGKRYSGSMNAVLQSFGAGSASTYFPGNANGTVATGAQQG